MATILLAAAKSCSRERALLRGLAVRKWTSSRRGGHQLPSESRPGFCVSGASGPRIVSYSAHRVADKHRAQSMCAIGRTSPAEEGSMIG